MLLTQPNRILFQICICRAYFHKIVYHPTVQSFPKGERINYSLYLAVFLRIYRQALVKTVLAG